jgi:tape measure domain-containing protein
MEEGDSRMSSVDDRIVNMQFNNKQFQSGAAESTKSLETLEQTIGKMGTSAGGMTNLGSSVDGVKAKFSALQVAGVTALATIVNKAVTAGLSLLKSFAITPITDGFHEYETNLNSIQTIMANTGKSVKIVNTYLNQLNHYSDQTIYSFTQMAESIGKFTAAGVPLKESVSSIKGLANTAALSGSNVQQLNTAMYQMSQALSTGTIRLMDWNSLANAGMGGSNIREALMATNRTLGDNGKAMEDAIKSAGSFRDSLQAGWLNAETFNKTMKVMAGVTLKSGKTVAFSVDQLKQMGYASDAAKHLHKLSQAAIDSATKVKTFTQLIDVVKESIGSGWAKVFQDLFGNFNQATKMWTGVSASITGTVSNIFSGVDKMLVGWRKLGGYQDLWDGFANIFKVIGNLIHPFVAAFQSILPATGQAGAGLAKVTHAFAEITGWMVKVTDVVDRVLTPVLVSLFGVFKSIYEVGKAVVVGLSPLFALFGNLASSIGNMVAQGAQIGSSLISGLLQGLNPAAIQAAVTKFANNIVVWIKSALGIHSPAAELVPVGIAVVQGIAEGIVKSVKFIINAIGAIGKFIVAGFKQLFGGFDALDFAALMNAIFTGGLLLSMRGLTKSFSGLMGSLGKSLENITSPFSQVTSTLKTMQNQIRAKILLDIAIAVGILTASLIALSLVNPKKIAIGIGALSTLMAELVGSMALLSKMKPQSITALGVAILAISSAMLVLSAAVAILGNLGLDTLAKGLGAIAIALGIMVVALKGMAGLGEGLPAAAAAIYIMSAAMSVLAIAVLALGKMDVKTLAKGLGAIAIGMTIFTVALEALTEVGPGVAAAAAGIYIVSAAMLVMAGAILALGKMKISTLAKGLGTMAIGLGIMVVALGALTELGPEVEAAAASILLMSTAMLIMATAIGVLGGQSLGTIAKGLGAMAIGFGILLAAAAAAIELSPGLIVLGASVAALGLGLALAGAGMLAAATAFSILAVVGTAGIAVLVAGFEALMALLPTFAIQVAASIVVFIQTIAAASPKLREAFGEIIANILGTIQDAIPHIAALANALIGAILKVVTQNIPKFGKLISTLIDTGIKILTDAIPKMANAGLQIITGILQGIANNLPKMINAGTDIIIAFIKGIGDAGVRIANAAGQAILDFLEGIADAIRKYEPQIFQAGIDIAKAIGEGIIAGLKDVAGDVVDAAKGMAGDAVGAVGDFLGIGSPSTVAMHWGELIVDGFVLGIRKNTVRAVGAVVAMANSIVAAGDKVVAKAQSQAERQAIKAARAQARADVADRLAKDAEKAAKQAPKNKALQKAANEARKAADRAQKTADSAERAAQQAATHVQNVQSFREADAQGKGDILTDQAKNLSERAVKMLAQANAEAQAAKKLQGKARRDMLRQARQDAKAAKDLADKSKAAKKRADEYYAKSVEARIKAIQDAREADERAQRQQERFDNATDAEKQEILQKRADREEKAARRMQKQSDALIKQAKKLAKTDAAKAQRLLDRAERLAQQAKDAADKAKQDSDQAQQYADQAANAGDTSTTGANGFTLSRTALEDAAKAIDRYTKSLQEAEEAAQADRHIYQFVQNNNSPDALSELDIYRQTRNLLSAQEIKMAAPT